MKKVAIICAIMMISIIPAFALNETANNTTGTQVQNQSGTTDLNTTAQNQNHNQNCQKNGNDGNNCGSCDGKQHMYQYGQKNATAGANNCENTNCPKK